MADKTNRITFTIRAFAQVDTLVCEKYGAWYSDARYVYTPVYEIVDDNGHRYRWATDQGLACGLTIRATPKYIHKGALVVTRGRVVLAK